MVTPIHLLPATRLLELYAARELSPVEATKAALTAIDRHNPRFNAFCLVDHDCALNYARQSEARWKRGAPLGPLDGVPTSVKDLMLALGWPTLRGSRTVDPDQDWNDDAVAVGSLRRTGAVLLGKTTTPEFGWKGVTDSPVHGITRNPWKAELTPGGSSGGAAVAAACGMGALHVGTDGGGSIRIPASFTGVFGFKPTYGIVPRHPPSPYGTLSTAGAITRTVADAALLMDVLSEPFPLDFYALPHERRSFRAGLDDGVEGWRIAFSPTLSGARVDAGIARLVAAAAGDEVEESDGDDLRDAWADEYAQVADRVRPVPGAADAVRRLVDAGYVVALASSGERKFAEKAVDDLGIEDVVTVMTTSTDADESKPHPELIETTWGKVREDHAAERALLVGDTPYDVESAHRAGIPCVAVLTGGFDEGELSEAETVLEDVTELTPEVVERVLAEFSPGR